jgi:RNA polymerase sigma factor (TIGR02999 family)
MSSEITQALKQVEAGDSRAADELLRLVYEDLRCLANARLAKEQPGQTLQATALVHEAYLRLVDVELPQSWTGRGHFFAAAAEAMRRILIERVRHKRTLKAGGNNLRTSLPDVADPIVDSTFDLLALDQALEKFEREHPRPAALVKLRFFAGLTIDQAAAALNVAPSTANADWVYAKSWLRLEMQ